MLLLLHTGLLYRFKTGVMDVGDTAPSRQRDKVSASYVGTVSFVRMPDFVGSWRFNRKYTSAALVASSKGMPWTSAHRFNAANVDCGNLIVTSLVFIVSPIIHLSAGNV